MVPFPKCCSHIYQPKANNSPSFECKMDEFVCSYNISKTNETSKPKKLFLKEEIILFVRLKC